jgi:putative oxidoreductase
VCDNLGPEIRGRNCEESCENDGAVESQQQAFHRSLEISQTEIPTFSQLRRRLFLRNDRGLKTRKTETVYTTIFTPPPTGKIMGFSADTGAAATNHIPLPAVAIGLAMLVELLGGIAILTGFYTRLAAWVLFLYLIPTTVIFHNFWAFDGVLEAGHLAMFEKNLAIMGGLLILAVHGAGSYSLDSTRKQTV